MSPPLVICSTDRVLSPEQFTLQIAPPVISRQELQRFIVFPQRRCPRRIIDQAEPAGTAFRNPGVLPDRPALDHIFLSSIICNIIMHLLSVKKHESGDKKVSVHFLHGAGAVVPRLSSAGCRVMKDDVSAPAVVRRSGMILDKGLLGIEIQPVIISRELPVKREDDLSGKKGRQRCLRSCLLSL